MTPEQIALYALVCQILGGAFTAWLVLGGYVAWRLWQPHKGLRVAGMPPLPPLWVAADNCGSMDYSAEQELYSALGPFEQASSSWRDQIEHDLAPEALEHDHRCISCGAEIDHHLGCPDDPDPDYEAEAELSERLVNVLRPGRDEAAAKATHGPTSADSPGAGPGHPDDFISAMSDDDFWNAARFELRAIMFLASEPYALPAWNLKAIAA